MTPGDTARLLGACAAYDQRTVGKADAAAWHLVLADLQYADAEQAVIAWYREHRERIMPSDVIAGVRAIRNERLCGVTSEAIAEAFGIDGDDPKYLAKVQARYREIANGNQLAPLRAIGGAR